MVKCTDIPRYDKQVVFICEDYNAICYQHYLIQPKWFEWLEIKDRQIKINVNEYEYDDILIVES